MARILAHAFCAYVCSDVIRTAILNWGPFGRWTPGRVRLPAEPALCAFSNTLCGMSHGDQHKTASTLCHRGAYHERVALNILAFIHSHYSHFHQSISIFFLCIIDAVMHRLVHTLTQWT